MMNSKLPLSLAFCCSLTSQSIANDHPAPAHDSHGQAAPAAAGNSLPKGKEPVLLAPVGEGAAHKAPEAKSHAPSSAHGQAPASHGNSAAVAHQGAAHHGPSIAKPTPDQVLKFLEDGNRRFVSGMALNPHADISRIRLAAKEDQGNYAIATILSCSDSRVPPEVFFDSGIMDLFVIRVAGNVADVDEVGSIEYGLAHVFTPVLVVLGHTQCGAVKAVTKVTQGEKVELERNIPSLVAEIGPAVRRAVLGNPGAAQSKVVQVGIEENIWEQLRNVFLKSPAIRDLVRAGKVKAVGAMYHLEDGSVEFFPQEVAMRIFREADTDPGRTVGAMAP